MRTHKNLNPLVYRPTFMQIAKGVIKMKTYVVLITGLLLILYSPIQAQQSVTKVGTTAAGFLAIDVGPRATAMGGAYVSLANDATVHVLESSGDCQDKRFRGFIQQYKLDC